MREAVKRTGRWVWTTLGMFLRGAAHRLWRLAGGMGLALRHMLTRFAWRPFLTLTAPFRAFGRWLWRRLLTFLLPLWRLLGRTGLALHNLLTWIVWRPLRWLARLLGWLYQKTAGPILATAAARIADHVRARWEAGAPRRRVYLRRYYSRWQVMRARQHVLLRRPKPPPAAVTAPRVTSFPTVRQMRLITVLVSVVTVLILSLITLQARQPDQVAAKGNSLLSRIIVATPTPLPPTKIPTPTVTPTPDVRLTPWPTPDPMQGGGSLVFTQRTNGNSDIYLLSVGQAELVRLTYHPAADRDPVWSPDGREIAFASHRDGNWEIYIYNLPEARLRRVTHEPHFDGAPRWSPDGQWLVFESYRRENLDIYIVKADGSEGPYRLTEDPALDYAPVWSPGGRHIAYVSWRSGNPDMFALSLDALSDEAAVNLTNSPKVREADPAFSPDGRLLAYTDDSTGYPLLSAIPLSDEVTATGPPLSLGQQGRWPAWARDGQSLAYVHSQSGRDYLFAASADAWGVNPQVFAADGRLGRPSWSAVTLSPAVLETIRPIDPAHMPRPLYIEAVSQPEPDKPPVALWDVPVNAPLPYLSDRVDQSFLALRERVMDEAGWDFLGRVDKLYEALDEKPLPHQTDESWNKTGRAFDFYYREVLSFEPRVEIVRQDVGGETTWRVYLQTDKQDGSQGEPLRALPWDFQSRFGNEPRYYEQGGRFKEVIPPGYYVDFTALAADYGWEPVPAASSWRAYFPSIRFWHFEKRDGLTWQEAMLEIYTAEELAQP